MTVTAEYRTKHAYDLFINGEWMPSCTGQTLDMIEPSTGNTIGTIACGTASDIDAAVTAARGAFEKTWRKIAPVEKGRMLARLGQLILQHEEALTKIEASDTGKPTSQANRDIKAAARYFEYYSGACDKLHGEIIPYEAGYTAMLMREPLGVTGHILPWNYPAQQFGRSVGPSLAAGNTIVLKPAEDACLSILYMAKLSQEAGFPPGVINVVPGRGNGAGSALAGHAGIDFISFTGSPEVGARVQELAAANYIGCTLELGGKSPQILFEDADLESALDCVVTGILQNTGQTCSASSRTLVQSSIMDTFVTGLLKRFNKVRFGHHELDLDCGPLITEKQLERVKSLTQESIDDGTPILFQSEMPSSVPEGGFYFSPIVFGPVGKNDKIAHREIFGPVLCIIPFEDEQEAIEIANGTEFGLIAAVWTRDADRLTRVSKEMRCGQVFMNNFGAGGGVELPFGGVKRSGHGREKGLEALFEFTMTKTLVHKHG